jgi:hypothetical protein
VRFEGISGRIDQGIGILFNLMPNGDYLTLRANQLENNLVLWKFEKGRRKWIRNTPTPSCQWHDLKVRIAGTKVEGYVDGKLYFEHVLPERVSGRIGLWSKADTTFRRLHRDASRLSNAAGGALRSLKAAKDYALVASPAALARDENARLLASDWMHASGSAMRDRID